MLNWALKFVSKELASRLSEISPASSADVAISATTMVLVSLIRVVLIVNEMSDGLTLRVAARELLIESS